MTTSLNIKQLEDLVGTIKSLDTYLSYIRGVKFRVPILEPVRCTVWERRDVPNVVPFNYLEFECVDYGLWRCDKLDLDIRI